jgi:hypothetical protein
MKSPPEFLNIILYSFPFLARKETYEIGSHALQN